MAWSIVWLGARYPSVAASPTAREYDLKAAFLFNFTKFIEWPPTSFGTAEAPLVVGILGEDPFGESLDRLLQGKLVGRHPLVIKRFASGQMPDNCQLLFVCRSEKDHWPESLKNLRGKPMLLVSETDGFPEHGGMINFFIESDKVRFAVNPEAAKRAGLIVSTKLLNVAKVFRPN